jgi:hypothetical protein
MSFGIKDIQHIDTHHNTLSIMALSIKGLFVTLSIKDTSIKDIQQNDTQHNVLIWDTQHKMTLRIKDIQS